MPRVFKLGRQRIAESAAGLSPDFLNFRNAIACASLFLPISCSGVCRAQRRTRLNKEYRLSHQQNQTQGVSLRAVLLLHAQERDCCSDMTRSLGSLEAGWMGVQRGWDNAGQG